MDIAAITLDFGSLFLQLSGSYVVLFGGVDDDPLIEEVSTQTFAQEYERRARKVYPEFYASSTDVPRLF